MTSRAATTACECSQPQSFADDPGRCFKCGSLLDWRASARELGLAFPDYDPTTPKSTESREQPRPTSPGARGLRTGQGTPAVGSPHLTLDMNRLRIVSRTLILVVCVYGLVTGHGNRWIWVVALAGWAQLPRVARQGGTR